MKFIIVSLALFALFAVAYGGLLAAAPITYAAAPVAVAPALAPATVLTRTYHGSPLINGLSTGTVLI